MKTNNIGFLSEGFSKSGAISSLVYKKSIYLSQTYQVHVFVLGKNENLYIPNVHIHYLNYSKSKIYRFLKLLSISRIIRRYNISLLFLEHTSFFYSYIKLFYRVKLVFVDHQSIWWRKRKIKNKENTLWREKIILNKCDYVISLTEDNKNGYLKFFPNYDTKIGVIPNFLSIDLPNIPYNVDSKSIVTVGRLNFEKRFTMTIDAFEKATKKNTDWKLYVYGDGICKKELLEKIKNKNLQNRVFIISGEKPEFFYKDKAFFIFNSRHEGLPLVLIEALYSNLPIISYNTHSGPSDIIVNNKNGILVDYDDFDSYVLQIKYLIEHKKERIRMSSNCEIEKEKYNIDYIMSKYISLIEFLIGNNSKYKFISNRTNKK